MIAKQKRTKRNRGRGCLIIFVLMLGFLGIIGLCYAPGEFGMDTRSDYDALQRSTDRTPQWSADGQTLVVNVADVIYGASVDGNGLWRVAYKDEEHRFSGVFAPSLSVNGEVAYIKYYRDEGLFERSNPDKHHIELTDINGTETKQMFSKSGVANYFPNWSPDGSRLAFATYDPSDGYQMIVMTKRESGLSSILTFWRKYDTHSIPSVDKKQSVRHPVWSNDSQRIVHVASDVTDNNGVSRIVNVRWDGADEKIAMEQERRIGTFDPTSLAWSIADDRIYFVYYEFVSGEDSGFTPSVRSVRPDGSDERIVALLWENSRIRNLTLSPDGGRLIFTDYRSPGTPDEVGVYSITTEGGELRKIFDPKARHHSGASVFASWAPDGERIAIYISYISRRGQTNRELLYTIDIDGSDAQVVLSRDFQGRIRTGGIQ